MQSEHDECMSGWELDDTQPSQAAREELAYPDLLSDEESKALLERAEYLWERLQANDLGGFSGINRPFWIAAEFKSVIEAFGRRDVGLKWSNDDLTRFERDTEKRVRESLAGEANVERVARAIALEFDIDPDVFIGMHGKEKWVNEWHKIARAALSTLERTTDAG